MNYISFEWNCIILLSVQNQHKCVSLFWKEHALLWNSDDNDAIATETEFNKCGKEMTKEKKKKKKARFAFSRQGWKNVRVFDRACSWTLVERLGQKGEIVGRTKKKDGRRRMRGKKAKWEIQLAIFYTSIFAVITT